MSLKSDIRQLPNAEQWDVNLYELDQNILLWYNAENMPEVIDYQPIPNPDFPGHELFEARIARYLQYHIQHQPRIDIRDAKRAVGTETIFPEEFEDWDYECEIIPQIMPIFEHAIINGLTSIARKTAQALDVDLDAQDYFDIADTVSYVYEDVPKAVLAFVASESE